MRDVQHLRQELDAEKLADLCQHALFVGEKVFLADRQRALRILLDDGVGCAMGLQPRLRIEQCIKAMNDCLVHRRNLLARILHDVQKQHFGNRRINSSA